MAKFNIYGHVLYSEIEYEKLMFITEKIFIQSLMNGIPDITEWIDDIWSNIDHEYMIKTLEEIKTDVIQSDIELRLRYKDMPVDINEMINKTNSLDDLFSLNKISKFEEVEKKYAKHISKAYIKRLQTIKNENIDEFTYLTKQIKNFGVLEQTISYFNNKGDIVRKVTPSTYLSMLYNVNLTRTGWNQTFKDAEYFGNDLTLLETHPNSCPKCAPMQGKIYSRTGKSKQYPRIEKAYENGVGHPNCKCEFSIFWNREQLKYQQTRTTEEEYKEDQKTKAIEREIRKQRNNLKLYQMIGNEEEADKTRQKIRNLRNRL